MKTAEEWHREWCSPTNPNRNLDELIEAVQADAIEAAAKVADGGSDDFPGDYRIADAIRATSPVRK